jgi:pectate lyase
MWKHAVSISFLCWSLGCNGDSGSEVVHEDAAVGSGGAHASGGASAAGGKTGSGGLTGTGGLTGSGGSTSSMATGGATSKGGASGRGGAGGATGADARPDLGGDGGSGGQTGLSSDAGTDAGRDSGAGGAGGTTSAGGTGVGGGATGGTSGPGAGGSQAMGGASGGSSGASSGGSSGSSGACSVPPDPSPLQGWAAVSGGGVSTTTGGGNATPTTVTSLSSLQSAVKGTNAAVIYVKGVLSAGSISVGSNKTIAGLCGAEIHGHVELSGSTNVIIRNIKIVGYAVGNCSLDPSYNSGEGCSSGADAISVQKNAHHIWFDHCDISDGTDGNLDITNGADYVTVSWTKFHYTPRSDNQGSDSTGSAGHRYSNLVGGTDSPSSYDDANSLNVTWHHNWWAENVVERQPRVRFGKNHVVNNLYTASGDNYCVRAGKQAHLLIENNVFSGVKSPHEFNNSSDQGTAYITSKGNSYVNTSGSQSTGGGGTPFTSPPYSYTADSTSGLQSAIQSGAGPK